MVFQFPSLVTLCCSCGSRDLHHFVGLTPAAPRLVLLLLGKHIALLIGEFRNSRSSRMNFHPTVSLTLKVSLSCVHSLLVKNTCSMDGHYLHEMRDYQLDGVRQTHYAVVEANAHPLYTRIKVDISESGQSHEGDVFVVCRGEGSQDNSPWE